MDRATRHWRQLIPERSVPNRTSQGPRFGKTDLQVSVRRRTVPARVCVQIPIVRSSLSDTTPCSAAEFCEVRRSNLICGPFFFGSRLRATITVHDCGTRCRNPDTQSSTLIVAVIVDLSSSGYPRILACVSCSLTYRHGQLCCGPTTVFGRRGTASAGPTGSPSCSSG